MSQLNDVNTTDIVEAIRLGCRTMQSVFNKDDDMVPFFGSELRPKTHLTFANSASESHVAGRHLNALLNAENAAGITLEEEAVENHTRAAILSYSGPLPLSLNRKQTGESQPVNFSPHNLREGFHALYALAKYRDSAQARELAEQSIDAIFEFWNPEKDWNVEGLEQRGLNYGACQGPLHGELRMLGPLVKYYRTTGYGRALELAFLVKEKLLNEFYLADGDFSVERFMTAHAHSITCVLSSLAQLADLTSDSALLMRVKKFYDNGLWQMRDEIGWSLESINQENSDHGEANNTGDILETALILGRRGYPECYHDAERILRCHLLPCQLRDNSFIVDPPNPDGLDGLHEIADRHLGAFGFPAPYGHISAGKGRRNLSFNMDIVGGSVGSLCEALRECVRTDQAGHWVNLLFDRKTDAVQVQSPYTHNCLEIRVLKQGPLFVRIPPWVQDDELKVEGVDRTPTRTGGSLFLSKPPMDSPISFRFPLKAQELTLSECVHIQPIRTKLLGDSVEAMENFGAELTYFPAL